MIWKIILVFHLLLSLEVLVLKMKRKHQIVTQKTSNSFHKVLKYGQIVLMNLKWHIKKIPPSKQKLNIPLQLGKILPRLNKSELLFFVFCHLYLYSKFSLIFQISNSIHPRNKTAGFLKSLRASLSSKAQLLGCVFDTPDGDALPITYGGAL